MASPALVTAAIQMCSGDDLAANLATVRQRVGEAAAAGAQLVVLPECFAFLGRGERDKMAIAESLDGPPGPILGALAELAAKHGVFLVGGGMPELEDAGAGRAATRAYNTAVVLSPRGELVARYRKIHLFDIDIPGKQMKESAATAPGKDPLVVDVHGWRVGVTICYDVRFPELYRTLVLGGGAEVLLVPAAFTAHTGRAHWHLLLRGRAVEDQAYVVAPAQWGRHNEKRESFGHTLVIDPWGTIVGERAEGDGVVVHALDREALARTRREMPVLSHATMWRR